MNKTAKCFEHSNIQISQSFQNEANTVLICNEVVMRPPKEKKAKDSMTTN